MWHAGVHALAVVSILVCGLDWPLKLAGCGLVLAHAVRRRPQAPVRLLRNADCSWSVPAAGLDGLLLGPDSAVGPFWMRLRLGRPGVRPTTVLLLRDQLDGETWRTLKAELRRHPEPGTDRARQGRRFNLE